jgi:Protein of unknown function (DUF3710)
MFRRRGRDAAEDPELDLDESARDGDDTEDEVPDRRPAREGGLYREDGPWDSTELDDPAQGRVDFGGLLIPAVQGMNFQLDVSNPETQQVMAITVVLGESAIQLMPFAAPRTEGIWEDVRSEIAADITRQGGIVDQGVGPFGPEMRVRMTVQLPDGRKGMQVLRFLGADGPRWFLRATVQGKAAVQPDAAAAIEEIFRGTVVVRGTEAMAPRDPIPLRMPAQTRQPQDDVPAAETRPYQGDLKPFQRGPEITEVR